MSGTLIFPLLANHITVCGVFVDVDVAVIDP